MGICSSSDATTTTVFKQSKSCEDFKKRKTSASTVRSLPDLSLFLELAPKKLGLSIERKILIRKYWENNIIVQRRDIFHKTMLASIESSPKMNEIIACGRYCYRDLTKWPKLDRICKAQFNFFHHLIVEVNLDEQVITKESYRLGKMHSTYAQFGLKPHFLDIFQLHLLRLLKSLKIENDEEKWEMLAGWTTLMDYIIECINLAYTQALHDGKHANSNNKGVIGEL